MILSTVLDGLLFYFVIFVNVSKAGLTRMQKMNAVFPSEFERTASDLAEIKQQLLELGADKALLKILPKNANDKNQVYWASSFSSLYNNFDLSLAERGTSTSLTKDSSQPGSRIPEAVFNHFSWARRDGSLIKARNVKAIIYTQYPEARLSGFLTIENTMPQSLSITYTKAQPEIKRLLVLGRLPGGACVALMYFDLSAKLIREVETLQSLEGSKICKLLQIKQSSAGKLLRQLGGVVSRPMKGCRLDALGNTLPFTGTQVCGYTLEHALGIIPNSGKNGDLYGIELKTHTQVKVTLFTPEPDFGLYAESFNDFMLKFGNDKGSKGEYRLTGIHRAGERCNSSGLTLKVREYRVAPKSKQSKPEWVCDAAGKKLAFPYNPATSLTSKMDAVEVVLEDDNGFIAAGWSLERLMNNWGVKHNEVVYISAEKSANTNAEEVSAGFEYQVTYAPKVIWCQETSAEHLLRAINNGVIFLDPAPKYVPADPSKNKRRAQWRVNDVTKAIYTLYEHVEVRDLSQG
ncbi:MvaI/BcnI family restriction endonuclease [Iodobacter arcticus]|uniref:MvaI/BcnI family restriction endonuclease n=1 Tax=Iodobacter arcticus TaxID=590593 RepID=A0ABW2R1R4_9NEIS